MAKFNGNIFSRARNSIGGVTFLKSMGGTGSQQTARQKVVPADAKTPAQQLQRAKMSFAVSIERSVSTPILKPAWDSAISKLPAYQSFISYLMKSMSESTPKPTIGFYIPPVGRGLLHAPNSLSIFQEENKNWAFQWSEELGENGKDTDSAIILIIGNTFRDGNPNSNLVSVRTQYPRKDGVVFAVSNSQYETFNGFTAILWFTQKQPNGTSIFSPIKAASVHL